MGPLAARRWLSAASLMTIVVGLVAAAASSERSDEPWLALFDLLDWPVDGDPGRFSAQTRAVNAVVGGVMVGWGTLMHLIVRGPFRRGDTTLAGPMLAAVVAWFVVDSTGSLLADLPGNVILNLGFLVLFLPPLLGLRQQHPARAAP
jgi:hypothetical protein